MSLEDVDPWEAEIFPERWTWLNQGAASASMGWPGWRHTRAPFLSLKIATGIDAQVHGLYKDAPATPWEITARIYAPLVMANYQMSGLLLYDSISGRLIQWGPYHDSGYGLRNQRWNSVSSWNANQANFAMFRIDNWLFLRASDDGTYVRLEVSYNGSDFFTLQTESRTAFLTNGCDKVGLAIGNNNTGWDVVLSCDEFRRTG